MDDRRTLRSLISTAALCAAAFAAACGSTPEPTADTPVPLPSTSLAPPDGVDEVTSADAAASSDAETSTDAGTSSELGTSSEAATPGETEPADLTSEVAIPAEPARWFPTAGTVIRLAGLSPADNARLLEERSVTDGAGDGDAGGDEDSLAMEVVVRAVGDADTDIARERYLVTVTKADVRIELAPDGVREVPRAVRELPRPPVKGAEWRTPAGRCVIEAVGEDVTTFLGARAGCVRVRVTGRTGRRSTRWFDPELGEIRREVHDRRGKLIAAWALCGDVPPPEERYAEVLLNDKPAD